MIKPRIYLSSPHMGGGEMSLVQQAFESNWIAPVGPHVDALEKEFASLVGSRYAAALSSGTAALHLAIRWLCLQPGDEVICSTLTFSASVNPIIYEGGTPVFVDSETRSWNMDPALLLEAVKDGIKRGRKAKAVILVHIYGQSADLNAISNICREYDIPLIEDAAEALGSTYSLWQQRGELTEALPAEFTSSPEAVPVSSPVRVALPKRTKKESPGSFGLCGMYSLNGNKIITSSGGGILVSDNSLLIEKARYWSTQARDPAPHYQHSELGYNYRMSNILAAIGRGQLNVLPQRVEARRSNFQYYLKHLESMPGLKFMPEADWGLSTRWLTCINVEKSCFGVDRETVRRALDVENIESRPVWKPMHLQPIFRRFRCFNNGVSEHLFETGLCLPSGSNLNSSDLDQVIKVVVSQCRHS